MFLSEQPEQYECPKCKKDTWADLNSSFDCEECGTELEYDICNDSLYEPYRG